MLRARRHGELLFNGYGVSGLQDWNFLDIVCTTIWMHLTLLNCTLENDWDGINTFYIMCLLPQFFKNIKKIAQGKQWQKSKRILHSDKLPKIFEVSLHVEQSKTDILLCVIFVHKRPDKTQINIPMISLNKNTWWWQKNQKISLHLYSVLESKTEYRFSETSAQIHWVYRNSDNKKLILCSF